MRTKWLCTCVVLLPFFLGGREAKTQESLFLDAVEVKVASVEVVVEDADGKKIPGLTAGDFEILEDGVRQPIDYFSAQENGQLVADSQGGENENAIPSTDRLHLAIFVDDVHLSPINRNQVFERLKTYLREELQPTDLVLVARLSDRLVIEQPFTDNVDDLEATLDRLAKVAGAAQQMDASYQRIVREIVNTPVPEDQSDAPPTGRPKRDQLISGKDIANIQGAAQAREIVAFAEERRIRVLGTVKALHTAVGSLAGLQGRKALIYLSDGLPVRPAAGLAEMWRDKYENWAIQNGLRDLISEISRASNGSIEAESQLRGLGKEASAARVAFYVLSPGSKNSRGVGSAEVAGTTSGGSFRSASTEAFESEAPLLALAEATGGKARTRNMDIGALLADVRGDFGTFYSLGYKPKTEAKDGTRQIVVKVRGRPDASVRYTRSLGDTDPVEQLRELTLSALYHGLSANPLGIELEAKPAEDLGGNKYRVDVMVKVPFEKILLLPQEANHVGRLTLFVVVQEHKNQNLSTMSRVEVPLKIPNDQILAVMSQKAAYPLKLEMAGGSQRLAIGMRDHLGRVSATVEVDLDVPDTLATVLPAPAAPPAATAEETPTGGAR